MEEQQEPDINTVVSETPKKSHKIIKYIVIALFILLPFVGFYLGMEYEKSNDKPKTIEEAPAIVSVTVSPTLVTQISPSMVPEITPDPNFEIPLATGSLYPVPGIEKELLDALSTGEKQYALVQLYAIPEPDERKQLELLGVTLQGYLTNNTYIGAISPEIDVENPELLSFVRYIGMYKNEYKINPGLDPESPLFPEEPIDTVLVTFFSDVSPSEIDSVMKKYVGSAYSQGAIPTEMMIKYDPSIISKLSKEKTVSSIVGMAPPLPLE